MPLYRKVIKLSTYEYFEKRFGSFARYYSSVAFVLRQFSGDVPEGLTLPDLQETFELLLRSGATIGQMNTVRKHLSTINGGQLCRLCNGAHLFTLMISDVPGDHMDTIASGPPVGDPSTYADALSVLRKYDFPGPVWDYLEMGEKGLHPETVKPGSPVLENTCNQILGSNRVALQAAAKKARSLGYHTMVNDALITGDAESEAQKLISLVLEYPGRTALLFFTGRGNHGKGDGGRKGRTESALCIGLPAGIRNATGRKCHSPIIGRDGWNRWPYRCGGPAFQKSFSVNLERVLERPIKGEENC